MAQIINLRETEYQTIVTELAKMHENQLQNVTNVIIEMTTLITSEDIFSANQTSQKIYDMLEILHNDVMMLLQQAFEDSEAGVARMISSVAVTDTMRK